MTPAIARYGSLIVQQHADGNAYTDLFVVRPMSCTEQNYMYVMAISHQTAGPDPGRIHNTKNLLEAMIRSDRGI